MYVPGLLSASDNSILTASLSGSQCRNVPDIQGTFNGEVFTAVSPHLNLHTLVAWSLDVGTGRGHCFWLPVFFYQANDLLLAVDASQADYARTWFADCLRGIQGGGLLREGTNRRGHEPSVTL